MSTWWEDYYDDIDNQRLDSLVTRHSPNVVVNIAGSPPVKGVKEAMAAQAQFFTSFKTLHHSFVNAWEVGDTAMLEAIVTYVRHDDQSVDVPCVTILHRTQHLVDSVRVYIDLAPVFA